MPEPWYLGFEALVEAREAMTAGDIAKMLAKMELIEGLHDESFGTFREVRPGIISFPADLDCARGHLGFATAMATVLNPPPLIE